MNEQINEDYVKWLENMVILLSKSYRELVYETDEETLKKTRNPRQNEIRESIRMIAGRADNEFLPATKFARIKEFTNTLIQRYLSKNPKELTWRK